VVNEAFLNCKNGKMYMYELEETAEEPVLKKKGEAKEGGCDPLPSQRRWRKGGRCPKKREETGV